MNDAGFGGEKHSGRPLVATPVIVNPMRAKVLLAERELGQKILMVFKLNTAEGGKPLYITSFEAVAAAQQMGFWKGADNLNAVYGSAAVTGCSYLHLDTCFLRNPVLWRNEVGGPFRHLLVPFEEMQPFVVVYEYQDVGGYRVQRGWSIIPLETEQSMIDYFANLLPRNGSAGRCDSVALFFYGKSSHMKYAGLFYGFMQGELRVIRESVFHTITGKYVQIPIQEM